MAYALPHAMASAGGVPRSPTVISIVIMNTDSTRTQSGFALVFVEGANEIRGVVEATNSTNTPPLPSSTMSSTAISWYSQANLIPLVLSAAVSAALMTN